MSIWTVAAFVLDKKLPLYNFKTPEDKNYLLLIYPISQLVLYKDMKDIRKCWHEQKHWHCALFESFENKEVDKKQ